MCVFWWWWWWLGWPLWLSFRVFHKTLQFRSAGPCQQCWGIGRVVNRRGRCARLHGHLLHAGWPGRNSVPRPHQLLRYAVLRCAALC